MLRITQGNAATIRTQFIVDEVATQADGTVSVTVKSHDGTVLDTGTATFEAATTTYSYTVGSNVTDTLGLISVEWSGEFSTVSATIRDHYEVVGARLTTVSAVRGLDALNDTTLFTTEKVQEAIVYAEDVISDYCGTMFVERGTVETFHEGRQLGTTLLLSNVFPRTLRSVTDDDGTVDTTGWDLYDEGAIEWEGVRLKGTVEVSYTHGLTPAPSEILWAARTIARQYLLDLVDRIPDRALSIQSDFGQIRMAQAGGHSRPTSMPDVNAALNRHRHRFWGSRA